MFAHTFLMCVVIQPIVMSIVMALGRPISFISKGYFEGDILLDKRMRDVVNGRVTVSTRRLIWDDGRVPYVIDSSLNSYYHARNLIHQAIGVIKRESCVSFVPRANEKRYVRFLRGNGCYSYVGKASVPNGQPISIGRGCAYLGIVLHEIMHSLGFFHTNSRPDRDSFVIVYYNNIKPGYEYNFRKYSHGQVSLWRTPYDLKSILHLPRFGFSRNNFPTLEARAGSHITLGQLNGLTPIDVQELNSLYRCPPNKGCFQSLGMEDEGIPDSSIRASSYQYYYNPNQARLHLRASYKGNGVWCSTYAYAGQYLMVDLGHRMRVSGLATQGKLGVLFPGAWVSSYILQYSSYGGNSWNTVSQHFAGNWDGNSVRFSTLPTPIVARYIKIVPTRWNSEICMRIELYGCDV